MAFNKKQHLEKNIKALEVAFWLDLEKRFPNDAEIEILQQYSGFGGLKFILNPATHDEDIKHWSKSDQVYFEDTRRLYDLIRSHSVDDATYRKLTNSLKSSVLTAFYTPPEIPKVLAKVIHVKVFLIEIF